MPGDPVVAEWANTNGHLYILKIFSNLHTPVPAPLPADGVSLSPFFGLSAGLYRHTHTCTHTHPPTPTPHSCTQAPGKNQIRKPVLCP